MNITHLYKTDLKRIDGSYFHKYKCYCGKYFNSLPREIKTKKTVSCGCYRKAGGSKHRIGKSPGNSLKDPEESSFNALFCQRKNSARRGGYSFEFNKESYKKITSSNCHYCGSPPSRAAYQKWSRKNYVYNGIDRIDSSIGYTIANSVPCCAVCNYMKKAHSFEFFVNHIKKIARHLDEDEDS